MTTPRLTHGSTRTGPAGSSAGPDCRDPAATESPTDAGRQARVAGVLYLIVIVLGLTEAFVRTAVVVPGDAAATAGTVLDSPWLLRAAFAANLAFLLCEVALTILLYLLLRPVSRTFSLLAAAFRLTSIAVYGVNLLNTLAALLILEQAPYRTAGMESLALLHHDLHAYGYALGLTFFAASCLAMGYLLLKTPNAPHVMGVLLGVAGLGYLANCAMYFFLPGYTGSLTVALLAPALVAEGWLCLWLLRGGARRAS